MIRHTTGEKVRLIFACAWCPKERYARLKKDEEYTHGVCAYHLKALLSSVRSKGVRL